MSNHQGSSFPVAQTIAEGYAAVICKASEGLSYRDPCFDRFVTAAGGAGGVPGGYHFLRRGSGAQQARVLHERLLAHGGPAGFLAVCDNEADATWDDTRVFVAEWEQLTGGHPLIMYSGAWWWGPRGWPGVSLTPYLWHSRYVSGIGYGSELYERVPDSWWTPGYGGWSAATILQYSSNATVAGHRPVDVNAFRGSIDDLRALTRPRAGGTGSSGGDMALDPQELALLENTAYRVEALYNHRDSAIGTVAGEQNRLKAALGELGAELPDDQVAILRDGLAAEVAGLLAPQLRIVTQLAERLGAAGDALGALNDQAE